MSKYITGREERPLTTRGYWLVRDYDGARFYIGEEVSEHKLNRVCNGALSDNHGYGYWVDYCLGPDVTGKPAWVNLDQTDRFI